ncbi:uncharacterized protein LOC118448792 isoform X2 [Vespa mandarinia]|uniref:uncharacterized protein LOC118448792 isoform X2 n=1 Tax=Vespa mandarinia TaxID=7446 RepID=UPI00162077C1|nr:uncharacterized protein LOC118448792 isoform X2 [Vespa mandarinia]
MLHRTPKRSFDKIKVAKSIVLFESILFGCSLIFWSCMSRSQGGGGLGYYLIQTLSITQRELEEILAYEISPKKSATEDKNKVLKQLRKIKKSSEEKFMKSVSVLFEDTINNTNK